MKKALVLFTNYFPFHRGEEYLETELPIARQYFDRILIIPTMVNSAMARTREVPEGVEVYRADTDCSVPGNEYSRKDQNRDRPYIHQQHEDFLFIDRIVIQEEPGGADKKHRISEIAAIAQHG